MTDIYETISAIRSTSPRPIFVFGSNEAGAHGAGAARTARYEYGAKLGVGRGRTGDAYAIPTKDANIQTRPLAAIAPDVAVFLDYARAHPELTFHVTRIGCGLAGYTDSQIGPMFAGAPPNCILPTEWRVPCSYCNGTGVGNVGEDAPDAPCWYCEGSGVTNG